MMKVLIAQTASNEVTKYALWVAIVTQLGLVMVAIVNRLHIGRLGAKVDDVQREVKPRDGYSDTTTGELITEMAERYSNMGEAIDTIQDDVSTLVRTVALHLSDNHGGLSATSGKRPVPQQPAKRGGKTQGRRSTKDER